MIDSLIAEKHLRYQQQAEWTKPFRNYLFRRYFKDDKIKILEVGCGTGAVLSEIKNEQCEKVKLFVGVDIDPIAINYAKKQNFIELFRADGKELPFSDSCFDLVFCHYFLLWVKDPVEILAEMKRVTKPGGICAAMAEPCYEELRAEPKELFELAEKQRKVLSDCGANVNVGSQLNKYFKEAGFSEMECGKYRENQCDTDFIQNEIRQMVIDSNIGKFRFDPKVKYSYSVPTYFAFAEKSKVE